MPRRGVQCDFDCLNCIYPECTNSAPVQPFETEMLDVLNGSNVGRIKLTSDEIDKLIENDTRGRCFCSSCAREKPDDGQKLCGRCIEYYKIVKRKPVIEKKMLEISADSYDSYIKNRERNRKRKIRQERRNAGLCVQCGKPNSDLQYFNCTDCREKDRIKAQKAREK